MRVTKMQPELKHFFPQDFNNVGECLNQELFKGSNISKIRLVMSDKKQVHPALLRYTFIFDISCHKNFIVATWLCMHTISTNGNTTASNSVSGALSLVCMQSWIIRAPWPIPSTFLPHRFLPFYNIWLVNMLCSIKICIHIIPAKLNNPQC